MIKCVRDLKKSLITLSHHVPNDLQRPNFPFGHFWSKVCQFICWYLPISFGDSLFLCCCIYQNAFSVFWVDMEIARTALYQMKQMNWKKKQKHFLKSATSILLSVGIRRSILNHNIIKLHPEYEICMWCKCRIRRI